MKNADAPVFPIFDKNGELSTNPEYLNKYNVFLTKREYFIAHAMQGFCASGVSDETIVQLSIEVADAILYKLEKSNPTT
jgi:hypothetical protein